MSVVKSEKISVAPAVGGVAGVFAIVLGRWLGWAFGLELILPLVAIAVVATRDLGPSRRPFQTSLAVLAGDLSWMIVSTILAFLGTGYGPGGAGILYDLFYVGGIVWLFLRPGVVPALVMIALEGYAILTVLLSLRLFIQFSDFQPAMMMNLLIGTGFAVASIVFLVRGLRALSRDRAR